MQLKFIGAIKDVTGSKHLIITTKGREILLDCGLYQGMGKETDELNRQLDINPSLIEAVILSHAHIDHSGNLPSLVKQGFRGKIYCTPATRDVCRVLLLDSAHIQENDVLFINKRRKKTGQELLKPLYTVKDVESCLKLFKAIPFNTEFHINDEVSFHFSEAGHIIGAASVNVTLSESNKKTALTFSGDVGRYNDAVLKAPAAFRQADYIICESTYGDRLHESAEDSDKKLQEIILRTCIRQKGKLIVPAFSLGRTQEMLYAIDKLKGKNLIPDIKIYVDSPLSASTTEIVRKHPEAFNETLTEYIKNDPDPFGFDYVQFVQDSDESKQLNYSKEPCIIISASGMGDAGRVKHHLAHNIGDINCTVLITGYCAPRTLGARLLSGEKKVRIYGDFFDVKASVESILSFSAHADYNELLRYLSCQNVQNVKNIFLVHGDSEAKVSFREKLLEKGFATVTIPEKGKTFQLV